MKTKTVLTILSLITIVLAILPYFPVDFWWVRSFDFPQLQLTVFTVIVLIIYMCHFDFKSFWDYAILFVLVLCIGLQFIKIYPYTIFSQYEVAKAKQTDPKRILRIYTANVLQDNDNVEALFSSIDQRTPDIVVLTETNEKWRALVSEKYKETYPYRIEAPLENTYGMMLYSKFQLIDHSIKFLVEDTIPSIHSKVVLSTADTLQLIAIHPAPPVPQHNPSSVDRDAEMMKVAKFANNSSHPMIVMGDFNDVAWSQTTKLFQRFSGLLDMRKGRGAI